MNVREVSTVQELFTSQRGLITRRQALAAGMSNSAVGRRLAADGWVAVLPGVYRLSAVPPTADLTVRAALLWPTDPATATISGSWAAWLHGLLDVPPGTPTLTLPPYTGPHSPAGLHVTRRRLDPVDRMQVRGIPVTTRAFTALDCAGRPRGSEILDRALQRGTTISSLSGVLDRLAGRPGAVAARRALHRVSGGEVSEAEREYARLLRAAGIRELRPGVWVTIGGDRFWLDFAAVRRKVAVEIDGWHAHRSGEVFHNDRRKQNALMLDDWLALRFTPRQVRDEADRVLDETTRALRCRESRIG